jgi:hypothetical protein
MSINYPTLSAAADLAHFRHFSSILTNSPSLCPGVYPSISNSKLSTQNSTHNSRASCYYTVFPDTLNYAKQTQSQVRQNQPKLLCDKSIRTGRTIGYSDKQTQNKPNSNPKKPGHAKKRNPGSEKKLPPRGVEPLGGNSKTPVNKQLTENSNPVLATSLDKTLQKYPDLAEIVMVWPELSEDTKKAIKALIQKHKTETK